MVSLYNIVWTTFFTGWTVFSIHYIVKLKKWKNVNKINLYLYEAIPIVFSILGVFGTFVGIYFGLQDFDVDQITESVPILSKGLKSAFFIKTSILGIIFSFVFARISQSVLNQADQNSISKANTELFVLNEIIAILKESKTELFNLLNKPLINNHLNNILTQLIGLKDSLIELQSEQKQTLDRIYYALENNENTNLLIQIQKIRIEQNNSSKETKENAKEIVQFMDKNNTETLVVVMKNAVETFNVQMSALINKLVKENFQELNNSVQHMNQWQQENKEIITALTTQFKTVSNDFSIASHSIEAITTNTEKLTNENSHLTHLIKELQDVMIEDTNYQKIANKLTNTIEILQKNTEKFDESTNKLNNWVRNQMHFSDSVAKLLTHLEKIEQIKDINEVFWNNTKRYLNEGINIIAIASNKLSKDLENINAEFYKRLNDTLRSLDGLIQRIIEKYHK